MAEAAVRCLRDGRLEGEHAPALAVEGSLQCCPLAAGAMLHVAAALASHAAAGKAQARGLVIVAFDRSPDVYLDFMRRRGLDSNALDRCVRILDCYSDPLGWKQKIQNQQHQENSRKQNITLFRNVKDVKKLMYSTTELGGGFEEGKKYFSIAIDSISTILRHASVPSISGLLSNLRCHGRLEGTERRRLYLNEVEGRGPGPRRRGGAVTTVPRRRGRRYKWLSLNSSMIP